MGKLRDDDSFDERDVKLTQAILDGVKNLLKPINNKLDHVYNSLIKANLVNPLTETKSPKQITERGQELLNIHNVDSYLKENCILLKDEKLKEKTDPQIFIECLNWVKTKGNEKVAEIRLNSNINEEQCIEILALALMKKVKK